MKKLLLLFTLTGALSLMPLSAANANEADMESTNIEDTQMQEDQGYVDESINYDESLDQTADEENPDAYGDEYQPQE